MDMDFKIRSSGGPVALDGTDLQPNPDNNNLRNLEHPADNQVQNGGRPRGKADRSRTPRPSINSGAANLVASRPIERNPTTFPRTGVGKYLKARGLEQPSYRPIPSFELTFGNGNVSVKVGANSNNGILPTDNDGQLPGYIQNTDCFGTGSDYQSFSFASGSDTNGTGGVVTSDTSSVAQTYTDTANDPTSQTSTAGNVQSGNPTPTDDELSTTDRTTVSGQAGDGTNGTETTQPSTASTTASSTTADTTTTPTATPTATTTPTTPTAATQPNGTTQTTPTTTTTENNATGTAISDATKAKFSEMETKVNAVLAEFGPKGAAAPTSHAERCKLAMKIAKKLTGANKETFLKAMETLGAPFGLNFGLSRTTTAGKVPLNQAAAKSLGKEEGQVNAALAADVQSTNTTRSTTGTGTGTGTETGGTTGTNSNVDATAGTGDTNAPSTTTAADPTPTDEKLQSMSGEQLMAMLAAQTDEQTTAMIKGWSTDGGETVTKATLTGKNPVLAKFLFEKVSGDSINASELTTWAIAQKNASKTNGATASTVDNAAFKALNYNSAMAAIKSESVSDTLTRVTGWSADKTNITKAELAAASPALAAVYTPFAKGNYTSVKVSDLAEALNSATSKASATPQNGSAN